MPELVVVGVLVALLFYVLTPKRTLLEHARTHQSKLVEQAQARREIEQNIEREQSLAAEAIVRSLNGKAVCQIHLSLRADGAGATCLLWVSGPGAHNVGRWWDCELDPPLRRGADAYMNTLGQGLYQIDKRLGLHDFDPMGGSLFGKVTGYADSRSLPRLPGFPWDGSHFTTYDRSLLEDFRARFLEQGRAESSK